MDEIEKLLDAYGEAMHHNGRIDGMESVSSYHEMDWADAEVPKAALLAAIRKLIPPTLEKT